MLKLPMPLITAMVLAVSVGSARAETILPLKISRGDIFAAVDSRDTIDKAPGGVSNVVVSHSADGEVVTGIYTSGPTQAEVAGPDGYPADEFMYFITGGATLTSTDGSKVVVNAGEGVSLPRGWVGTFATQGYTKLYVSRQPAVH
jgi:uncharacterized cupin superfamily protein